MAFAPRVRHIGLGEPPDVEIGEGPARRAGAALDGLERQADHVRRQPHPRDDPVGHPSGQLERPRSLGGQIDGHAPGRAMHLPAPALPIDRLAAGEPPERDHGVLEAGERGGRRADGVDGAVARAEAEDRAPARQLVDARHRAGRDDEVPGQRIGHERAQAHARGIEGGERERHVHLAEHRLRVRDAEEVEPAVLRFATERPQLASDSGSSTMPKRGAVTEARLRGELPAEGLGEPLVLAALVVELGRDADQAVGRGGPAHHRHLGAPGVEEPLLDRVGPAPRDVRGGAVGRHDARDRPDHASGQGGAVPAAAHTSARASSANARFVAITAGQPPGTSEPT